MPYIVGILLANHFFISINRWFFIAQLLIILAIIFAHLKNKRFLFIPLLYLLFLSIGYQNTISKNDDLKQNHFSNFIDETIKAPIECTLVDWPVETQKYYRVEVKVDRLYSIDKKLTGSLKVYLTKSNVSSSLVKHAKISFVKNVIEDDNGYVVFLDNDWKRISNNTISENLNSFNTGLLSHFKTLELEERALVASLLFGRREFLSWDMKKAYQKSGMIHLLAISGLHIGIIYLFLNGVLGFLSFSVQKRRLKSILIIGFLIFYAAFTGFSPSVSRAVLMFSLFAFGDLIVKPVNRFQVLLSAAFILLLVNPMALYSVGAQLSFTAVFFIIWVYPKYKNRFEFKYLLVTKVWQMLLVSLIAQLAVAPLLMYYFGSISLVATFTSILGIPLVIVIIGMGILLLMLSVFRGVFNTLLGFYEAILGLMNAVSNWFSKLPFSQLEVSVGLVQMVLIYTVILFLLSKKIRRNISSLVSAQFYHKV